MNLFFVHPDPIICAQHLCDKHIVKMVIESRQMLSFAWHLCEPEAIEKDPEVFAKFSPTHSKHPTSIWTRATTENYVWHVQHWTAMAKEYQRRYKKVHESFRKSGDYFNSWIPQGVPEDDFYPPPQCMFKPLCVPGPEVRKKQRAADLRQTVRAYREFYRKDKSRFAKWNYGPTPEWFRNEYDPLLDRSP